LLFGDFFVCVTV